MNNSFIFYCKPQKHLKNIDFFLFIDAVALSDL